MFGGSLGTISNQADWSDTVYVFDENTSDPIDLTGDTITMKVARAPSSIVLTASTSAGEITLPDTGYFSWSIPASRMTQLCAGTYRVSIILNRTGETLQFFLGTVTVEGSF